MIDHLNGHAGAAEFISTHNNDIVLSVVTRAEVLVGYDDEMVVTISSLLNSFNILEIDSPVADLAAKFRRSHRVKLPDAFQAALALHHDCVLVTRNTIAFKESMSYFGLNDLVLCPYET